MPSPTTRRELLGGVGLAGASVLGVELLADPAPDFEAWTPAAGSWPAARGGPRRLAAAPDATPPGPDAEIEWTAETNFGTTVVVDDDGVAYVGDEPGVVAVDLADGSVHWRRTAVAGTHLCVRDGTLYCGARRAESQVALDAADGSTRWRVNPERALAVYDVLALEGTLLVGRHGRLQGRNPDSGNRRWEVDVGGAGYVYPAVADGTAYVGGPGPLETYRPREGWGAVVHPDPRQVAEGQGPVFGGYPAVTDDGVYIGGEGFKEGTALYGFAQDGRSRRWQGPEGDAVTAPAVAGSVGVVRTYQSDGSEYRLVGVDLRDGAVLWRRPPTNDLTVPVVVGDLAVVATNVGDVEALDPGTGDVAWEASVPGPVDAVVPAGERLLLAGSDRMVRSLR